MSALLLIQGLCVGAPHKDEYFKSLIVALLFWQRWHEEITGCCYSEEAGEAMLSRLGAKLQTLPGGVDVPGAMDVFLFSGIPTSLSVLSCARPRAPLS